MFSVITPGHIRSQVEAESKVRVKCEERGVRKKRDGGSHPEGGLLKVICTSENFYVSVFMHMCAHKQHFCADQSIRARASDMKHCCSLNYLSCLLLIWHFFFSFLFLVFLVCGVCHSGMHNYCIHVFLRRLEMEGEREVTPNTCCIEVACLRIVV